MDGVLDQLAAAGLVIVGQPVFGKLTRCKVDDDRGGKLSGWYVLHELRLDSGEAVVVGRFGNWKRFGDESLKVELDRPALSSSERARLEAEQQCLREQARAEKLERAREAASRALRIWAKLPDSGKSDYLARKRVMAFGLRFSRGSIVVPVTNGDGLVGLQFISGDGTKKFLTGTAKHGAWHLIGEVPAPPRLWIAEGYATAATIHQAMGEMVVVAFDAGNLLPAARLWRARYPDSQIVIAADNDVDTEGNPGVTRANEAAAAVGGVVVVPQFEGRAA